MSAPSLRRRIPSLPSRIAAVAGLLLGGSLGFWLASALWAPTSPAAAARPTSAAGADPSPPSAGRAERPRAPEPAADPVAGSVARAAPTAGPEPPPAGPGPAAAPAIGTGTLVHGHVRTPDGAPIGSAAVRTTAPTGDRLRVTTDALGRYVLGPLGPGTWRVVASTRDHFERAEELRLAIDAEERRVDFTLATKRKLAVVLLRSDGRPTFPLEEAGPVSMLARRAVPVATAQAPGPTYGDVTGSLNNRFGIGVFWQAGRWDFVEDRGPGHVGTITLQEDLGSGYVSYVIAGRVVASLPFGPGDDQVVLTVDPEDFATQSAVLRGRVVDATSGEGLAARVGWNPDPFLHGPTRTETDPEGRFEFSDAPTGERYLVVDAEGRALRVEPLELAPGEVRELGDLLLPEEVRIAGRVLDVDGEPVVATLVQGTVDESTGEVAWNDRTMHGTDEDGEFRVGRLAPGTHALRVTGVGSFLGGYDDSRASLPVRVTVLEGESERVEIRLRPTRAVTVVQDWPAEPWPSATFLDERGQVGRRVALGRYSSEYRTRLVEGAWRLRVELEGELLDEREVLVADEPLRLELDLER